MTLLDIEALFHFPHTLKLLDTFSGSEALTAFLKSTTDASLLCSVCIKPLHPLQIYEVDIYSPFLFERAYSAAAGDAAADIAVERIVDDIRPVCERGGDELSPPAYGPDGGTVQVVSRCRGEFVVVVVPRRGRPRRFRDSDSVYDLPGVGLPKIRSASTYVGTYIPRFGPPRPWGTQIRMTFRSDRRRPAR